MDDRTGIRAGNLARAALSWKHRCSWRLATRHAARHLRVWLAAGQPIVRAAHRPPMEETRVTRFEYEILIGKNDDEAAGGVLWFLASDMRQSVGDNLPAILNGLGNEGWEAVALGDIGFDARAEILLKRKV
jgi:hypothetical protein